ncbi:MAG: MATE family efflux transporter [Firmicutes bacterium]|nr:MATE family efflux transporter [Bacillota bacterium]
MYSSHRPDNQIEKEQRRRLRRMVLSLALPILAENLLLSMMEYVDTAMVGSLGPNATASVACTTPVIWLLNSVVMALAIGATVVVAQSIGAGNHQKAQKVSAQAFLMVLVLGTAISGTLLLFCRKIPVLMGLDPEIQATTTAYIAILALGMPFHCISAVFYGVIRGAGDTRTPMALSCFANVCNIIGNFLLIYTKREITLGSFTFILWGAGLGVAGAAIASSFARVLAGLIVILLMLRRTDVTLRFKEMKPDGPILREIIHIGLPAAMERIAINGGHLLYARLVAGLGTITLAAHQLAQSAESICYLPAMAFETAATTLAGQSVGAQDYPECRRRVWMTARLCICFVAVSALILFFGCGFLLGLLTPSAEVIAEGSIALRTVAVFELCYGIAAVFSGGLRGVGATREPFYVCLGTMWLLRIPLALFLLNFMNGGIGAVWFAMSMDLVLRCSLLVYRFHKGNWERKLRNSKEKQYD